jgi:hypothetical protein
MKRGVLTFAAICLLAPWSWASATKPQKWSGSQTSPVHQIPLKDEFDQPIIPTEKNPLPFSSKYTCAPCHDYSLIRKGRHFDAISAAVSGRPGEPWIWVDERTGTLLPLSYHSWKGSRNPKDLGLSPWDFTLLFGRHMSGGGISEPDGQAVTSESRWNVSGKIEIDCLGCHNASRVQNHSEWAKQILRQNFRWAATAAAGLGEVGGMASRLGPTWDVFDGPNPDDSEWAVAPSVKYNKNLFDSKHRAFLDLTYKPDDARCLACHATAPAGIKKYNFDEDVHTAAGIACVSCHRHDVSHDMIRGYEGEAADNPALAAEDFTCRACHLGGASSRSEKILPGRMGAPYPKHNGLPAVHFERLACTVCHSGPLPANEPTSVRTARANRLGIFGIANWTTELPVIQEPIYIRDKNGKLTPHRLMWPAFWAEVRGKEITPLKPDQVLAAAGDLLFPEKSATRILTALFDVVGPEGTPMLVMNGKVFEMNVDGGLDTSPFEKGKKGGEYYWAVKKDGKYSPLIPDFDPANPETAAEPEARIQKALEALAADPALWKPVLAYKGFLYQLIDNNLDKSENKSTAAPAPQFFRLKDGKTHPVIPDEEKRMITALAGTDQTLTEEQVALVLKALGEKEHAYISGGKLFRLNDKGKLEAKDDDAAAPVAWPLAHQVRPARQALGVNGCTDCHSSGSDFFFGKVKGTGPLRTENVAVRRASSFMGVGGLYHRLFGLSFTVRPAFKVVLFICAFVIGALLLIVFLIALGRFAGLIEKRK